MSPDAPLTPRPTPALPASVDGGSPSEPWGELRAALAEVRAVVADARFPLPVASHGEATEIAAALRAQLDDYLIPRLRQLDAPLLAVVGGSTGAGKSTLVNSLVRAPVSRAGVLRPTTRAPLLLAHPADLPWFVRPDRLPGLTRGAAPKVPARRSPLQVVSAPLLRPGVALIDAPDIDSVVAANRTLARELLRRQPTCGSSSPPPPATPTRPRGAALRERARPRARRRDRAGPGAARVDRDDDHRPLRRACSPSRTSAQVPFFVIRESTLDGHGMLPESEVAPVKTVAGHGGRSTPAAATG